MSTDQPQLKYRKVVLFGLILGVVLFALVVLAVELILPPQSAHQKGTDSGYVYSGAKSESTAFASATSTDDTMLLFGSSELSTPASVIPQVPIEVFGKNDYGLDLYLIGEAYDQDLWHAIAAGAYEPVAANKKIVFIVSPTWFEDEGLDHETFKLRFSYELYRQFCENEAISQESKDYARQRLAALGIDQMTLNAAARITPIDVLNDFVLNGIADLKIRWELQDVRKRGIPADQKKSGAEFDEAMLYAQALEDAAARSTENDWGMDDSFYNSYIEGRLDELESSLIDETFQNEDEYNDFAFFLKICHEVGFEPLVIVGPVHGKFYDLAGTTEANRQKCYNRIKEICEAQDVPYVDFTDREYEDKFLYDIVHFGWTGWAELEEAIYSYAKDQGTL